VRAWSFNTVAQLRVVTASRRPADRLQHRLARIRRRTRGSARRAEARAFRGPVLSSNGCSFARSAGLPRNAAKGATGHRPPPSRGFR